MITPATAPILTDSCTPCKDHSSADSTADFLVLVNKLNPIPDSWDSVIETVTVTNLPGRKLEVEAAALQAYLKLQADLQNEGILIDLDSARRTIADQQRILDEFTLNYGSDYARNYVALPGFSEHHTGLAIDVYLIVDGKAIMENSEMMKYPELWTIIHRKLPAYGFILRYPSGREHITGYGYEPWHFRYVGLKAARDISEQGITLEGYLGKASETIPEIHCEPSSLFSSGEMETLITLIKCRFAQWQGVALHRISYAGDKSASAENLNRINSLNNTAYVKAVCFLIDFHSPNTGAGPFAQDHEYKDDPWWLAQKKDGSWDIVRRDSRP